MTEHEIQRAVMDWVDCALPPETAESIFAIPNGGHRDIRTAVRLKREGVRAGVSDIEVAIPRPRPEGGEMYHGMFIEIKTEKGRLSPAQTAFLARQARLGYSAVVAHGVREAIDAIAGYLGVPVYWST
jgi:hypothetical protein